MTQQKPVEGCEYDMEQYAKKTMTQQEFPKLAEYLLSRAEQFQHRGEWDSSFECLYLLTVLNRGYYWDKSGRHKIEIRSRPAAPDNVLYLTQDGAIKWDSTKPELMKELIMKGIEVQMPIEPRGRP